MFPIVNYNPSFVTLHILLHIVILPSTVGAMYVILAPAQLPEIMRILVSQM